MLDKMARDLKKKLSHSCNIIGKERKYSNAAVLIPLIEINKEIHVLYQVRSPHIRQGGEIGFPGGMMEVVDEARYEKTAIRETVEELGISSDQIKTIGYFGTLVAHSDVTIDVYVGILNVKDLSTMALSEEVESVFTVPLKTLVDMEPEIHFISTRVQQSFVDEEGDEVVMLDAKALGLPDKYSQPWRMRKRKVYFYRYLEHIIWGMTGEITYEFLKLVK